MIMITIEIEKIMRLKTSVLRGTWDKIHSRYTTKLAIVLIVINKMIKEHII